MSEKNFLSSVADLLPAGAAAAAIAGIAGGLVHWVVNKKSIGEGMAAVLVGSLTAVYVGPFASPIIGAPVVGLNKITGGDADPVLFGAFICGLAGISIVGLITDLVEKRKHDLQNGQAPTEEDTGNDQS